MVFLVELVYLLLTVGEAGPPRAPGLFSPPSLKSSIFVPSKPGAVNGSRLIPRLCLNPSPPFSLFRPKYIPRCQTKLYESEPTPSCFPDSLSLSLSPLSVAPGGACVTSRPLTTARPPPARAPQRAWPYIGLHSLHTCAAVRRRARPARAQRDEEDPCSSPPPPVLESWQNFRSFWFQTPN